MFQLREGEVELKRRSPDEVAVNKAWITRTRLVAEGLPAQPYIHLDIRTPFGESVDDQQVENALTESLGPRKDRYARGGWHIQFVEDTNLGSNHRVFVDLRDAQDGAGSQPGMDSAFPLEVAAEALGEAILLKHGESNFQLLLGGSSHCHSVLYVNGSPYHVLRIAEAPGEKAASRLIRHRDFAQSAGKGAPLRTFLCPGDPLASLESIRNLAPETADFNLRLPDGDGQGKGDATLYLHLGLALAAVRQDYREHNRVEREQRLRNQGMRGRSRFALALLGTVLACLLAAGIFALLIRLAGSRAEALTAQAAAYRGQVETIRALRVERSSLVSSLAFLKPVWSRPVPWLEVFAELSAALPAQAGMDGLSVNRAEDGSLGLSFRAWVKDWDKVREIERRLSDSRFLEAVSISEQRKDMATGAVVFHVSCRLERR